MLKSLSWVCLALACSLGCNEQPSVPLAPMDAAPPKIDTMLSERDAGDTMDQWIESMDESSLKLSVTEKVAKEMARATRQGLICL